MKQPLILNGLASTALVLTGLVAATVAVPVGASDLTLREWSEHVWTSARSGDSEAVRKYLSMTPEGFEGDRLDRIREGLTLYRVNRENESTARIQEREDALEELRAHLEEGDISQALRSAVTYQTLSKSLDAALDTPEIRDVIARTRLAIPQAEADGDWLYMQELLFRLRTLYDDTAEREEYARFDRRMKEVNRRIMLLQLYAPQQLHELRNRLALRLGEEPLPEFNVNQLIHWAERVEGVTSSMVKVALRATAYEHIEARGNDGWRPLLHGGLMALETLVSSDELDDTFPGLSNEAARSEFLREIQHQDLTLSRRPDRDLQYGSLETLLDTLEKLNARTVRLPREVLLREFADGAMYELGAVKEDDYSGVVWPDEIRRFRQQTEGSFVGVGIIIRHNERRDIVVANPLEGTPAFRAGIRPEDIIQSVDNEPTVGWSLNDAVERITGKRGTAVKLGIKREGNDGVLLFEIERDTIELPSVMGWNKVRLDDQGKPVWDWLIDDENRIAYVRVTTFAENTLKDLLAAWDQMQAQGVQGLILDLRFNPGGLLDQAANVANLFVREGAIVSVEGKRPGERDSLMATRRSAVIAERGLPVVVLVNKGSASASEIVSGALQAHDAALIVGTRTWGKGSVQRVFGVAHNAQLKLTTQYYRLPARDGEEEGRLVHKRPNADTWGVDPDVHVEMTPSQIKAAMDLRDDADRIVNGEEDDVDERPDITRLLTEGIDPQLETALLILQARVAGKFTAEQARLH